MPNGQPPFGFAPDVTVALDDLPEGGFGWFLIKDLARDVSYERQGNEKPSDTSYFGGIELRHFGRCIFRACRMSFLIPPWVSPQKNHHFSTLLPKSDGIQGPVAAYGFPWYRV